MVGPRITLQLLGTRVVVGVIDLMLGTLILFGVLQERFETPHALLAIGVEGALLVAICLGVSLLSERLRVRVSRSGPPSLPVTLSIPSAYTPSVTEAQSPSWSARSGLAGMGIDLAIGLIAVATYLLVESSDRRLGDLAAVGAVAIAGSAGVRFLAAPSLNGGRILRWMLGFTLDDDEDALRGARLVGYAVSVVLFVTGIVLLTSEGEAGFWGVGLAAIGINVGVLSTFATRQTVWLQTADKRTVGELIEMPHAIVSSYSSLDEMVSVLSVDGPRAMAVVRDANQLPVGIMQFQQMRAGMGRRGNGTTIGEVMIPLSELPEISPDTTLLEAARILLETGCPAVRYKNARGKTVIATARDIGLPR